MSNNSNGQDVVEQQGKKSSLWLLAKENAIVIPIIQRDYAQGRVNDDVRQIRELFLKKIFKVLNNNSEKLELDFIYGSLETPKDISIKNVEFQNFVPLDGQQRLTTLFLLHWFLSLWNEEDFESMKQHFKGRFSYATRLSSSEFCDAMLEYVSPKDVIGNTSSISNPISSVLNNEGWFHHQWKNDPSICGMLVMLDTMHRLFSDITVNDNKQKQAEKFFERLTCEKVEDTAITFNLLYLNKGDFHLSDELYIKMNSRGKPLSDFETFKARFESFMMKYSKDKSDFAGNIDGKWADVFWRLRNNIRPKSEEKKESYYRDNTDGMMMNVIKVALANEFAILAENNDNGLDELFESQVAKKANPDMHLTFYRYSELGVFNEINTAEISENDDEEKRISDNNREICLSVYNAFSFIYELYGNNTQKFHVNPKFMNITDILNKILFYGIDGKNSVIPDITYQDRLLFWALSEYCNTHQVSIQSNTEEEDLCLNRWMRFVRNMVESTEYNKVSDMQRAIKFLRTILFSMEDRDIIHYLSNISVTPECSPFTQSQMKEEILKAQLITCNSSWEKSIIDADNVESWPGRSGYLLFFSGLSDKPYDEISQWDESTHDSYRSKFEIYKQKMDMLLSYLNSSNFKEDCLLERALLSKGNYLRKESNDSIIYSMMDQSVTSRSYSFRQMVQYNGINCDGDNSTYKEGVSCLKDVLDDSLYIYSDIDKLKESLQNIIKASLDKVHDWRWPLLESSIIWREAKQRFIWISKGIAWVVRKKSGNTNRYETWSYYLYSLLKSNGLSYSYYSHDNPRHTMLNFKVDDQRYQLKIEHNDSGKWQFDMTAIEEDYQQLSSDKLNDEILSVMSGLMPNKTLSFEQASTNEAIQTAKEIQTNIKTMGEVF